MRPAPGADEWGIDKIDRAWLIEAVVHVVVRDNSKERMSAIFYLFKGPRGAREKRDLPRGGVRLDGSVGHISPAMLACCMFLYNIYTYACMPAGD